MDTFIVMDSVKFSYGRDENFNSYILNDINLKIKKGEFIAVLGRNGCGKSTFAKLLNAINVPTFGKVFVDGLDTNIYENIYKIRKKVGFVLQNPDNQIVSSVVEEDVAFGPENIGMEREKIRKSVDYALRLVGMYEYRLCSPQNLSGGQKQRVAIAGALAMNPSCIVFDEPTSMLDPQGRDEVIKVLLDLNKNYGTTIVIITHHMEEAVLADRILIMDKGKIVKDDNPRNIFCDIELIKRSGLSLPVATELLYRLNLKGHNFSLNVLNEEECANELIRSVWG